MAVPDEVVQLRFIEGVNRTEDARVTDQGSWFSTQNLYARSPGVLAKRPGSRLVVNGRPGIDGGKITLPLVDTWDYTTAKFSPGESILSNPGQLLSGANKASLFANVADDLKGTFGLKPKINPVVPPSIFLPYHTA